MRKKTDRGRDIRGRSRDRGRRPFCQSAKCRQPTDRPEPNNVEHFTCTSNPIPMFWQGRRESDNVEDERSGGGGGRTLAYGGGVGSVIMVVLYLVLGGDPQAVLDRSSRPEQRP